MISSFLRLYVFFFGILWTSAFAEASPIRITVFGDSLASGYNLQPEEAFPAQLEAGLRNSGYNTAILNKGIAGETTTMALERLDAIVAERPEIVIVVLGTNDASQSVAPERVRANLNIILDRFRKERIRAVLAGSVAPLGKVEYAKKFNPVFRQASLENETVLYPYFLDRVASQRSLMQADGVHPTKEGVQAIVWNILPYIIPVVEDRQFARTLKRQAKRAGNKR